MDAFEHAEMIPLKLKQNVPIEKRYWKSATGTVFQELTVQLAKRFNLKPMFQSTTVEK